MRVIIVPCLSDNYAYVLTAGDQSEAVVVDPSDVGPVEQACTDAGLELVAIMNTHHHWDHVGGNEDLLRRYPSLRVFGHVSDRGRIPGMTDGVEDGEVLEVIGLTFQVLHVPGHTRGAVTYGCQDCAFTGDTLFAAGCGRLFEGTAAQLYRSLHEKLARLPAQTRVFCGHEYTAKNLQFAVSVEPENARVRQRIEQTSALRARRQPTVPTTVGEELATNPFLRTHSDQIRSRLFPDVGDVSPERVFAALRSARNQF